jgi:hypothetical protein
MVNTSTINRGGTNYNSSGTPFQSDVDFEEVRAIPGGRYGCA